MLLRLYKCKEMPVYLKKQKRRKNMGASIVGRYIEHQQNYFVMPEFTRVKNPSPVKFVTKRFAFVVNWLVTLAYIPVINPSPVIFVVKHSVNVITWLHTC